LDVFVQEGTSPLSVFGGEGTSLLFEKKSTVSVQENWFCGIISKVWVFFISRGMEK